MFKMVSIDLLMLQFDDVNINILLLLQLRALSTPFFSDCRSKIKKVPDKYPHISNNELAL
jgi:hypothetical protein